MWVAKNSKIKVPAEPVSGKGCSLLPEYHLVAVASHDEKGKGSLKPLRGGLICSRGWSCYFFFETSVHTLPLLILTSGRATNMKIRAGC